VLSLSRLFLSHIGCEGAMTVVAAVFRRGLTANDAVAHGLRRGGAKIVDV